MLLLYTTFGDKPKKKKKENSQESFFPAVGKRGKGKKKKSLRRWETGGGTG